MQRYQLGEFYRSSRPSRYGSLYAEAIAETERKLISRVLQHTSGNQAQAARILGITRVSLRKKLRTHGIDLHRLRVESAEPPVS